MTAIEWHKAGEKTYSAGVDRGVLYPRNHVGVAWNGLISVVENSDGGESDELYYDGVKVLDVIAGEDFQATIDAISYPDEFEPCIGNKALMPGLILTRQPRERFGFAYRSLLGSDSSELGTAYRLHLVYNASAAPSSRIYTTLTNTISPSDYQWSISTVPVKACGRRPTSHLVIDSREVDPVILADLEALLYGTETTEPHLPTQAEVVTLLGGIGTGVYKLDVLNAQTYNVSQHDSDVHPWFEPYANQGDMDLADYKDETYELTVVGSTVPAIESNAMGLIAPYVGPLEGCDSIKLFVRISVEKDDSNREFIPIVFDQHRHGETTGSSGIMIRWNWYYSNYNPILVPNDGKVHEFVINADAKILEESGWDFLDEILPDMRDVNSLICYQDTTDGTYPTDTRVRLHKAWVEVEMGCPPVKEPVVEYTVALANQITYNQQGFSSISDPEFPNNPPEYGNWSFSGNGRLKFDFDPVSAEFIYNEPVELVGWRIDVHVASTTDSTPIRLYYNFGLANPGISDTSETGSYTAYGPKDDSPGSYIDITGPGDYSLVIGDPYFNWWAVGPYAVLDRMRNGEVYNHGYGEYEGKWDNPAGKTVVIDDISVVFFT